MNRRLRIGIVGLVALFLLAGCSAFGGAASESAVMEDRDYDWETDSDVVIDLGDDAYTAVHTVENQSTVRVYQSNRYGIENPLPIRSVQFRYTNGTVVNASQIDIDETRSSVYLHLPEDHGQVAFTASKRSTEFRTPVFTDGEYTVKVPPGERVDNIVFATVRPGGSEQEIVDDRVHVTWSELSSGSIRVEYYTPRDVYLFAGLVLLAGTGALIGIGYVYRQIQQLRRQREELGLDVDVAEDDSDPPPGMR